LPGEDDIKAVLSPFRRELEEYVKILCGFSGKVRLTGPSDEETLWNEHILDCAYSLSFLPPEGSVIDVGTGGGLPGILWSICRPELEVHLLDSIRKKCGALEEIVEKLGLENTRVVCARAEQWAVDKREYYALAAARAVTNLGVLAEYLSPLVSQGGRLITFKGPAYLEEMNDISSDWMELGLSVPVVTPYRLKDRKNFIISWVKEIPCPHKYPRRPGMAAKKPWWR